MIMSAARIAHRIDRDFFDRHIRNTLADVNDPSINDRDEPLVTTKGPLESRLVRLLRTRLDHTAHVTRSRRIIE